MKKLSLILLSIFTIFLLSACVSIGKNNNDNNTKEVNELRETTSAKVEETKSIVRGDNTVNVELSVKNYGIIKLAIYKDVAPITADNFINLVRSGFYDGLTFHRIIKGFMIQGGDPLGDGTGGSKDTIKGEFASNGVQNNLSHKRGVISMARTDNPNSASSQFFIMHHDYEYLDGEYAAFGEVTSGIEVVDEICEKVIPVDNNGTILKEDQPIIEYIKVID